jgi:dUTP pyrophosphatase
MNFLSGLPRLDPYDCSLRIKKLSDTARIPTRAHEGDLGLDLYCSRDISILAWGKADVHTDICVGFPTGIGGRVIGRSSTLHSRGLIVVEGTIDPPYTGELFIVVFNPTPQDKWLRVGDKFSQLLLQYAIEFPIVEVDELEETIRGDRGFGSSGLR